MISGICNSHAWANRCTDISGMNDSWSYEPCAVGPNVKSQRTAACQTRSYFLRNSRGMVCQSHLGVECDDSLE